MSTPNNVSVGGGVSTIEVTVPVEVTIPVEVTVPGETVTIAGDTVTITVPGEPVTVTVEAEPTTVTVEAEPVTVTVEAEPATVTVEAEPVTVTVEAEPVTVTVEAEPATVTVEAEPVTVTVEAEPTTVTVQADPKTNPTFSLGEWAGSNNTYSAVVSYNGDGVLTANTGTLSGSTITVSDKDGNFSGVISAAEGTNFAPAQLVFNHSKETVGGGSGKPVPELYVEDFSAGGYRSLDTIQPITYTGGSTTFEVYKEIGNGDLGVTIIGNASTGYKMHVTAPGGLYGEEFILYAYENSNYGSAHCHFYVDTGD